MNNFATIMRESRLARFLLPAGLMLIVFGVIFFFINKQNQDYLETESTVTKIEIEEEASVDEKGNNVDASYKATVKYTVDGKEYQAELSGVSRFDEGDKVKIYYDPADPSQVTMSKSLIIPLVIIAAGIAFFVAGIISGMNAIKRYRRMRNQEKEWANGN
ncbi:MAG: DUF3592 domain-containing protein [Lachnospiraceae bacterium]|nr:DUF3592 domain-containing protein [Lachnospiraceae bacterium]